MDLKRISSTRTIFIIVLAIVSYGPALGAGFIWDDDAWVYKNPYVTGDSSISRMWFKEVWPGQNYPLTYTFFWLQSRFWGLNPVGFHLGNVLLHILNGLLLWLILKRRRVPHAWFVGAIFILHPLMVESVAWVTEAKNTLSAFLLFSSLIAWQRFEREENGRLYFLALLFYLLALLSKTFIATFPAVLLLLRWSAQGSVSRRYLAQLLPFFALSLLAGLFTWNYEVWHVGTRGPEWILPVAGRAVLAGKAFWFYLGKLFLPVRLTFMYPRWDVSSPDLLAWGFPLSALALLLFLWIMRGRWGRGPFCGLVCYAVLLSPSLGFIGFYAQRYSYVADHYAYLAMIGPIAVAAAAFSRLLPRADGGRPLAAVILVGLAALTFVQARDYRDEMTLWKRTIEKNPSCWMAFTSLGLCYMEQSRYEEATACFVRAGELNPGEAANSLNHVGVAFKRQGRIREAEEKFREALRVNPDLAQAHGNLGTILFNRGETERALEHFSTAIRINPGYAEGRNNLGIVLAHQGKLEEARKQYETALRFKPYLEQAHYNLANLLWHEGRADEAEKHYRIALSIRPALAEAHLALSKMLRQQGKAEEARAHLKEAVRLKPELGGDVPDGAP